MKKLLFLLLILLQLNSYSQQNSWKETLSKINYEETVDQPIHFKQFTLNTSSLLKQLNNITKTSNHFSKKSTIKLPNEKGELISYEIYEKSNFAPELADKYPEIKSYIGKSSNGLSTANISYSPSQGFNVAILNATKSTTLIKPTIIGGNTYIVFSRNEISIENPFECEDIIAARTNNSVLDTRNINDGFLRKYRVAISTTAEFSQFWLDGTETSDTERKTKVIAALNTTLTRINGIFERDFSVTMELIANNDLVVYLDPSTDPYSGVSNSILQSTLDNVIGDANYDVGHLFHFEGSIHGNAGCIACVCTPGSKGSGWTGHSAPDSDNFNLIASHEFGHQFGGWHVQSSSNCRSSNEMQEVEPGSGSTIMGYAGICPANVQSGPDDYFNYVDIRDVIQWTRNDSSCAQLIASGNTAPTVNAGNDFVIPKSTPFILEGTGSDTDGDTITFCWEENDPENPNSSAAPTPTRTQGPMFRSLLPVAEPIRYMPSITDVISGNTPVWEVLPSISRTMDFVLTVRDNHAIGAQTASDEMTVTVDSNAGPFTVTSQTTAETWNVGDNINITWNVANTDQSPINTTNVDVLLSIDGGLTYPYVLATNIVNNGNTSFYLPNVPTSTQGRFMIKATNNIFYAINSANLNIQASEFVMNFTNIHEQACKPNDIIFNFTYNTFLDFDETTTFSAVGLPTGATISFNPTSATSDGTLVQATISNTSGISLGIHNFIIKGIASSVEKNVDVSLNIFDPTIASPILINPTDGETTIDPLGILNWNNDVNADTYTIDIATDSVFSSIIETATVSTNEYQASNLDYDTTYYWRVNSNNTCGTSAYSITFSFTTFCIAPSNVFADSVLLDNATINWTENGNATSWEIETVEVGQTPTGTGVFTSINPYTVTGLNSSTEYIAYVRSSCGSGNFSDWTVSSSFTTASDFCAGDHFYDTGGVSGPYQNSENITTTIAPSTGNNTIVVTFNYFNIESGWDYLYVYDGSDTSAPLLGTYTGTTLPGPFVSNNPNGTLTFKFTSDSIINADGWDATVECLNITCPRPSSFTALNVSYDSLDLSWIAGDTETNWEIEYGITGFSQGTGTLVQTTNNTYSITGLNPNTTYDFYLRANCGTNPGDDDSLWAGPNTVTTLVSCPQPSNLYTNTTYNSAEISWINGNSETNWEIEYGTYGFTQGTGTLVQTNSNPYTITGLDVSTSYQVYIRALCGTNPGDDDSNWVGPYYFYTQSLPYPTGLTASLDQTNGEVSLNWNQTSFEITDFVTYYIYRGGALLATSTTNSYIDTLPIYGNFYYYVTAVYDEGESYQSNIEYILWESCPVPTNFVATNETTSSIDLSWINGNTETNWEIEYGYYNFDPQMGVGTTLQISSNPFTLTGLNHSSKYDVYLRAICGTNPGDDDSNWIGPITFSTLCDTFNTPYFDDLESFYGMSEIENCWTASPLVSSYNYAWNIASYGYTPTSNTGPSQANSGSTFFYTESGYYNAGDVAELTTPVIDVSTLTLPQLSFYYHMYGSDMGSLHVDIYNNGTWTNDEIIIDGQQQTLGTSSWIEQTLVLNEYTGTIQIRFRGIRGNGTRSDMAIDDIQVIETPSCPKPTNLTVDNLSITSADLNWMAGYTETDWEIEYGISGFTQGAGTTIQTTTNTYSLTGLDSATSYDVYLKANCGANPGDDDSLWVGPISFTTLVDYCSGDHFYDTGGVDGNYSNNENTITTIAPSIGYNNISVDFNSFSLETCCDYLQIYDGPDTNAPLLGQFTTNPGNITSTHASGSLTFLFHSDGSVTSSGWDATVNCYNITCPQPTNFSYSNTTPNSVDLSWIAGDMENNWEIEYGTSGFTQGSGTTLTTVTNPYTLTGLIAETSYDIYLRAVCGANPGDDDSLWIGPISFNTLSLVRPYNLTADLDQTTGEVTLNWNEGTNDNIIIGDWILHYSDNCTTLYDYSITYYADYTFDQSGSSGTWSLNDNTLTLNWDNSSFELIGTLAGTQIINGIETGGSGCWTSDKVTTALTIEVQAESLINTNQDLSNTIIKTFEVNNDIQVFQNYKIYRDGVEIGTSIPETYLDQLPAYGDYNYYVTSIYDEGESSSSNTVTVNWHGTPNIVVTPLTLSQTLYTDETATQTVTITNNGDDDLNFSINSTVVSTNLQNIGFGNIELENLIPQIVENSFEEMTITPTYSKRTFFNLTNTSNILIYEESASNYYTDALNNLGYTYTQVSSYSNLETTLSNGTAWDLVIVNSYFGGINSSVLDNLDLFRNNGGSIIFAEWNAYSYSNHPLFSNMGINFINELSSPLNFSAIDNSHKMFTTPNTVNSFVFTDDQAGSDGQIVTVINGASQLAAYTDYPTSGAIVLNANQNCIFNAFQSANFQSDDNANGKLDVIELIENQISFLIGNSWLSTTQTSGTVFAGSSVIIDVNFDSADMTVGTYNGVVEITSNDPDEPIVNVTAELIVIDDTDSIDELSQFNFKYYPNPFENSINLSANQNFNSVKVYSMLGQELIEIIPENQSQLTIDVSKLSVGTYFMKVEIDGKSSSMKIIKK